MNRRLRQCSLLVLPVALASCLFANERTDTRGVTFTRDVAPVLQKNCQGCHRAGEAAPFSLLTYEQARPCAKAMKEAVVLKKMPPWFAEAHTGRVSHHPSRFPKK